MKQYRVIHLPDYRAGNPYQKLLSEHLSDIGHEIKHGRNKTVFSFIDVSVLFNLLIHRKFDILHLHWQHPYLLHSKRLLMMLRGTLFLCQLILIKLLRVKIVWTIHNLKNHENKFIQTELFFSRIIAKLADAIIAHCNVSKMQISKVFEANPDKIAVIPHGNYVRVYSDVLTRPQARQLLDLKDSEFVFLFLGLIRPYKGIVQLIDSFKKLNSRSSRLIIAGRLHDKSLADILLKSTSSNENITLKLQYIDDDDIEVYMKASDALVLPYQDIVNSGTAILGMSFGKPVICPRMGCLPELLADNGNETLLYDPADENGLLNTMNTALQSTTNITDIGKANLASAKKLGWKRIATLTNDLYHTC